VVPLSELPAGHRYVASYKDSDPVVSWGNDWLFRSFSSLLMVMLANWWSVEEGVGDQVVVNRQSFIGSRRYGRLVSRRLPQTEGIAVGYCVGHSDEVDERRLVIVSGFRPNETIAAYVWAQQGIIRLRTTERSAAAAAAAAPPPPSLTPSQALSSRFPVSTPLWLSVLRRFELETNVITPRTVG